MKKIVSVLLVDDDKDDQYLFTQALSQISNASLFDVAGNGKVAIACLERGGELPDIIFMDVNMPVMNGIECLTHMRNSHQFRHIPIVMLTTDTGHAAHAKELGAVAFINKPHDGKSLREKIQHIIDLDHAADGHIAAGLITL